MAKKEGQHFLLLHDRIYRLPGVGKWAVGWRLRVINLSAGQPEIRHLRPLVVVVIQTGERAIKANCAQGMGKMICKELELDIERILWIEHFPKTEELMRVAIFKPDPLFGAESYSVFWRPVRPNEIEAVRLFVPEIETMELYNSGC